MDMNARVAALAKRLRQFSADRRGAIAITFALSALLLLCVVFAAMDATRIATGRTELQDALDSAILAAGASSATDDATLTTVGKKYMTAQLSGSNTLLSVDSSFKAVTKGVTATATASVDPLFMDFFTGQKVGLSAKAEVIRGQDQTLEVALVLDTTGSMAGIKITTLQSAAKSLVAALFKGNTAGEVKVGVVPFANYVNMGVASRTQPWANVPADTSTTSSSTTTPACYKNVNCVTTTTPNNKTCTSYNDGVPTNYACGGTSTTKCDQLPLNPCPGPVTTTSTSTKKFQGCYGSPLYPDNVSDNNSSRKYPGFLNLSCSTQVTPLTATQATVTTAITALSATGETYIPAGLAWGFNMLSPAQPMTEGGAYDTAGPNRKPRKVLILMTDGANTKLMRATGAAATLGMHDISPVSPARAVQADTYTAELCTNIKAQKIEVYAVAFDIGTDVIARNMVKACATDDKHFYDAADSAALTAAFAAIAASLQALHLTK